MTNLPPVQLPTPNVAPVRAASSPATVVKTAWDHKHALVTAGLLATVLGPLVAQYWPMAGPAIAELERIAGEMKPAEPPREAKPAEPRPPLSVYETAIRQAWAREDEESKAALRNMIFLYRRTAAEAMTQHKGLGELYKSFRAEELQLDLVAKLPLVRGVIRAEWARQVPEVAPVPLSEPLRVRVCDFLRQTVTMLERLP